VRVLHAYNLHRGGGGANNATHATIQASRDGGIEVEVFARTSRDVAPGFLGRLQAGLGALHGRDSVPEFIRILDQFRPHVVHAHELFPLVSPWILPECKRRGVPVVMSFVDYRLTCPVTTHLYDDRVCTRCVGGHEYWAILRNCRGRLSESASMALYSVMVRARRLYQANVAQFIAPSDFTREWLVENAGIDPGCIRAIAPIVAIPPSAADPAQGSYVAYAGRFSQEKGIETLLEAARLSGLPFRLARNVKSLVSSRIPDGLVDVVVTHGPDDLAEFYRGARVVVVPSLWFETFGLVAAEAMSHGIPVVASRIGALEELVGSGDSGAAFEAGNARALAEAITVLWKQPDLCRRLGETGRKRAVESWSAESHLRRLRAVYETAAGGGEPGAPPRTGADPLKEERCS